MNNTAPGVLSDVHHTPLILPQHTRTPPSTFTARATLRLLSLKRQPASGFHRSRVRQEPREYHFTATTRPVDVSGSEQLLLDVRKTGAGPYRLPSSKLPTGIRPAGAQKHLKSTWQLPLRCVCVCESSTKRTRARRVEHEEDYRLDMHVDRYVGQVQGPRKR